MLSLQLFCSCCFALLLCFVVVPCFVSMFYCCVFMCGVVMCIFTFYSVLSFILSQCILQALDVTSVKRSSVKLQFAMVRSCCCE